MLVVMALALGVIGFRLAELQTVGNPHFDTLARGQLVYAERLEARRGSIFDRTGAPLALSVPRETVYADPALIKDPDKVATQLAPLVKRPVAEVRAELQTPNTNYVRIAEQVAPSVAVAVDALGNPGIGLIDEPKRFTPNGRLAGPVLGSVGTDGKGLAGLESAYESVLSGRSGRLEVDRDPNGRVIPAADQRTKPSVAGSDLVLTIDQGLQYQVEKDLTAEVEAVRAKHGMAVIADVRTGDVLAMAQIDGPTARRPAQSSPATSRNLLFTDPYEPGSTTKVITAASALESGAIDPTTRFDIPASIRMGDALFVDDEPHPTESWTVRDILERSSNVGAIRIASRVGRSRLDRSMRDFGFGARTAIRFPGESGGLLPAPTTDDPAIMGSMPIGYGAASTAMQTLQVFATVANGGMSRPLRLVDATIDADGQRHPEAAPAGRRIISKTTAATLNDILQGVVERGTGMKARLPGVRVAGKTGTARKPPYVPPLKYMASFAGFAPAQSPRLVAVVVLDEPQTEVYGGSVAAPVFAQIMQDALRLTAGTVSPTAP